MRETIPEPCSFGAVVKHANFAFVSVLHRGQVPFLAIPARQSFGSKDVRQGES